MIQISDHAEGCVLSVRAQPGARRNAIVGEQGGSLKIAVTAPPDQGRANKALVEVLCQSLKLKKSQIELLSGQTSREKKFLVRGIEAAQLSLAIQKLLARQSDLIVLSHPQNRGYGAALITAFDYFLRSGRQILVTMDCDGQHEPSRLPVLLEAIHDADIVSGSRYLRDFHQDSLPTPA